MLDRIRPHLAISASELDTVISEFKALADAPSGPESWSLSGVVDGVKNLFQKPKKAAPTSYVLGDINDSYEGIYKIMASPKEREPNFNDTSKDPDASKREITVEEVHPSVFYRQQKYQQLGLDPYVPAAMKGWVRIKANADGKRGWKWVKYDNKKNIVNELWEFQILDRPGSVEVRFIEASLVKEIYEETEKLRGV
jgi:hypothetical protein